jgi:hypothetical protein
MRAICAKIVGQSVEYPPAHDGSFLGIGLRAAAVWFSFSDCPVPEWHLRISGILVMHNVLWER